MIYSPTLPRSSTPSIFIFGDGFKVTGQKGRSINKLQEYSLAAASVFFFLKATVLWGR
jgi:hypothetical protein